MISALAQCQVLQWQVEPAHEARVHARHRRVALLPAGDGDDLGLRMTQQDLDGFESRVASGTEDSDFDHRKNLWGTRGGFLYRAREKSSTSPGERCRRGR
jgi:hypothetical protein